MNYWLRRDELKKKAKEHTADMRARYSDAISETVKNSIIYGGDGKYPKKCETDNVPVFYFLNTDSVSAVMLSKSEKKAVLNFASYKNPGGKFIEGSSAQEESLCHASFLYNVLSEIPQYYNWNNYHKNRSLYENRAVYSPKVVFEQNGEIRQCDVITCAAPNKGAAQKYQNVSDEENLKALFKRIAFVKDIAEENDVETLILGAFGCGVFRQDAEDVCDAICSAFKHSKIKNIVMPVPGKDKNMMVFRDYFQRCQPVPKL